MSNFVKNIISTFIDWMFPPRQSQHVTRVLSQEDILSFPQAKPIDQSTYALFAYKDIRVSSLIWEIKYHKNISLINLVVPLLADVIIEEYADKNLFENWKNYFLVPVPSSKKRIQKRGYSHTEEIAQRLTVLLPSTITYIPHALRKTVDTPEQNKLKNRSLRLTNLHHTQEVTMDFPPESSVILIDDVTTTGATLDESRRALKEAGVKNIIAFTIAH
ncbi:MAG: phosphoribosyltransferase family protein [Candidatus Zambryskibacteria bacterium]|nr:phosphoribosyltransferase family protein [Candidatus Zambryskibacteria bacterium]